MSPRLRRAAAEVVEACRLGTEHPDAGSALRRAVAERDPLRFALTYLARHLKDDHGTISLSSVHEGWVDYAAAWSAAPAGPGEERDAFIAPREMGKSTWFFLLLPLWAAASGRVRFAAAFADSATQAEGHLATFKRELDENDLLRTDYPDLCRPAQRPRGSLVSDNRAMLHTSAGFVFAARGIDSGNLGMKVGARRPDLLILDDVEPGESNYSAAQVEKRLSTITDVVLPLNNRARVCLVGTVTMPGSIVHQLVQHAAGTLDAGVRWPLDDRWRVHHAAPITEAGESVWPEKWPTAYLRSIAHTRSYAKNFLNLPVATDGAYWTPETFVYGDLDGVSVCLLSVDPAVTTKRTSDYSGLSVVGGVPGSKALGVPARAVVRHAERRRLQGAALRARALALVEEFPEITHLYVETNQGGDLWRSSVFHNFPVPVLTKHNTEPKEVRAARAVGHYERGRVLHARPMPELEANLASFPKAPHDDDVDAVVNAVNRLLAPSAKKAAPTVSSSSY